MAVQLLHHGDGQQSAGVRYRYDLAGRLVGLRTTAAGGAVVADRTFRHNAVGNVVAIEEPGRTESYRYDILHRLLEATYPEAAARRRYSYDAVGNRLESRIGEQAAHHHKYDAANRLLEIRSGSATGALLFRFEYDKSGNLTAKRDGAGKLQLGLRYDERNLVVSAQFPIPTAAKGAGSAAQGGGSTASGGGAPPPPRRPPLLHRPQPPCARTLTPMTHSGWEARRWTVSSL